MGKKFNRILAISRKRWEIRPRLLLITNTKWHTPFQIKWKSWTLDNLESHWQPVRSAILATAGLFSADFAQVIRLEPGMRQSGCVNKTTSAGDRSGSDSGRTVECRGGRLFRSETHRRWHVAISSCTSPVSLTVHYSLVVYGHQGACPPPADQHSLTARSTCPDVTVIIVTATGVVCSLIQLTWDRHAKLIHQFMYYIFIFIRYKLANSENRETRLKKKKIFSWSCFYLFTDLLLFFRRPLLPKFFGTISVHR